MDGLCGRPICLSEPDTHERRYPTGRVAWVARYYDEEGKACYAKPDWNAGRSSLA